MTVTQTETRLMWDAARGVGFLPIATDPSKVYDADYFEKYVGYSKTVLGESITQARVLLLRRHYVSGSVCDIGIGCGSFVEAWKGAHGFDVSPSGVEWLKARNLYRDPYRESFDVLTFWDSLEHIPDADRLLRSVRKWVFASLPIVAAPGPPSPDWKHYRPDEHCWYWTRQGFIGWMLGHGFKCVEVNDRETQLGREDVESFAFHRAGIAPNNRS